MNVIDFASAVDYLIDVDPIGAGGGSILTTRIVGGMQFTSGCTYQVVLRADLEYYTYKTHQLFKYDISNWQSLIYDNTIINFVKIEE